MEQKQIQYPPTLAFALVLALFSAGCGQAPAPEVDNNTKSPRVEQLKRQLASLQKRYDKSEAQLALLKQQRDSDGFEPITSFMAVPDILDEMLEFRFGSKSRRSDTRRLYYLLESLIQQGDVAVPHILKFLEKMEDVDYAIRREGEDDEEYAKRYRNFRATLSFSQPPTMRIAMVDVLAEIGTSSAEAALAELLKTTARGFEIAYTARALRSWLGAAAYSKDALAAAHELLVEPVEVPGGNHFDRVSKNYLFMVLDMYNDQTFVQSAQAMFINDDGRIDRTILNYFDNTGKDQALDAVVQAFRSGRVHESDMDNLASMAAKYVGKNPQADQLFRDILTGSQYNLEIKRDAIESFTNSDGDRSTPGVPKDVLQARLNLLNSIQFDESDLMGKGMELLAMQMEAKITGERIDERKMRDSARRLFGEMEKRVKNAETLNPFSNRPKTLNAQPTIVPAP